jgi:bifunctional UDP-N-acetylglucosamine pyrophosphorylase / glucosamine-1-phosphate N-acetyltransferase
MIGTAHEAPLAKTTCIVLAAGQGTRMKSALPKVMHAVCGYPLVNYPVAAALAAGCPEVVVVVGHGREHVEAYLKTAFDARVRTATQVAQLGTGDAAKAGLAGATSPYVLICNGDTPLVEAADFVALAGAFAAAAGPVLAVATAKLERPHGYGRIVRDATGQVLAIREQKDATPEEQLIAEVNSGIYFGDRAFVQEALGQLEPSNAQKEYYLTDIVSRAHAQKRSVLGVVCDAAAMEGVNDRVQLAGVEEVLAARIVRKHRLNGVTVRAFAVIEHGVKIAPDAIIESYAVLRGSTEIAGGANIGVGAVLTDVSVFARAIVLPYTVATRSVIGEAAQVGPFSHLRPDSELSQGAHVGNFVETKKTKLGVGAKANHLAYLGDGEIGPGANIGAGTIFCNYDGFQKHTTVIEEGAFIGCDSHLVAPVRIGKNAYVATGTTVTMDVPDDALAISRPKQENKEGYAPRIRGRLRAAKEAALAKAKS